MTDGNLLILSVSRKTLLCNWFLKAGRKHNIGILGTDINPNAAALNMLDGFTPLPEIKSFTFLTELIRAIKKNNIKLIIPTREEELLILPRYSKKIEKQGCAILCNTSSIAKEMINKRRFMLFCIEKLGFQNIRNITSEKEATNADFPLYFRGAHPHGHLKIKLQNKRELKAAFTLSPRGIATTYLHGAEISVDAYISREGKVVYCVPRTRDVVLGGESIMTTTIDDLACRDVLEKILSKVKIRGPLVLQGVTQRNTFVPFEINLRFGGASMLAFKAACSGADLAIREYIKCEKIENEIECTNKIRLFKDFKEIYTET